MNPVNSLTQSILKKLKIDTLESLVETLPTTQTSDAHILKAEESYSKKNHWEALHHLSLTHSTLMYHRLTHKQYRPQRRNSLSDENCSEDLVEMLNTNSNILRPASPDETKTFLQQLPSDWVIVQVTSEGKLSGDTANWKQVDEPLHMPPIYIARCRGGPQASVVIQKIKPPKEQDGVRSILQEIELIKGENKVISKHYKNDQEKYLSKKEEVNYRLRILVQSMENGWLRHSASLLCGLLPPSQQVQLEKRVKEALLRCQISVTEEQLTELTLLVSYPPVAQNSKSDISLSSTLKVGVASILEESVRSAKVKGLSTALLEVRKNMEEQLKRTRSPVILVLDKRFVSLPWEMIQPLQNQSVTRMPSLQSLFHLYQYHSQKANSLLVNGVDASKGYFILDPENNLPRSQERLQQTFQLTRWEGIQGQKPSQEQFKDALSNKDVFVYVGHGSGSQYMPAQLVETVECRSLVLLYGCSSASLARRGAIPDPWGVILNYLIASCPCVVGMLWEVMDKDTDLLTREMIRALRGCKGPPGSVLEDPPTDIPLLVARARPLCSWYLISAALVVYGLPLQVVPQMEQ